MTCCGRVAIAGVLAQQPSVLLLDELTTFLDGEDQGAVLRTVRQLASPAAGVTVLWVCPSKSIWPQADLRGLSAPFQQLRGCT